MFNFKEHFLPTHNFNLLLLQAINCCKLSKFKMARKKQTNLSRYQTNKQKIKLILKSIYSQLINSIYCNYKLSIVANSANSRWRGRNRQAAKLSSADKVQFNALTLVLAQCFFNLSNSNSHTIIELLGKPTLLFCQNQIQGVPHLHANH